MSPTQPAASTGPSEHAGRGAATYRGGDVQFQCKEVDTHLCR